MTLYDSSFLIDYLDGNRDALSYVEQHADEQAKSPQLALYEVYVGELHTRGDPNFDAVDDALAWIVPVNPSGEAFGRHAAELLARLHDNGSSLSFRDGYIAASAWVSNERLVTRDRDFDTPALRDEIAVEVV